MENDKPRILVIGAGVNGSVCAARLHAGGVDVTVLARPQRVAVLERDGIIIENPFNQRRTIGKVPLISELAPSRAVAGFLPASMNSQRTPEMPWG